MKANKSVLRKGDSERRWRKNQKRFTVVAHLRDDCNWTWADIGRRFKVTRQAAFKFYTEQKKLLY